VTIAFGPIELEVVADLANQVLIEVLAKTEQGKLRAAALAMHRYNGMPMRTSLLIVRIEAAATIRQPIPKGSAFQGLSPTVFRQQ
jgi:hypothetical protein